MEFTRSSDSVIVTIKVVIVADSSFLAGLVMRNYLVAIACLNSKASQRIVVATASQS